jgi:hypothetical protein
MQPSGPMDVFVFERVDGEARFNFPQRIRYHSPTGMEFGYAGSGPADTALNVLIHFVDGRKAWALHQDFKRYFISWLTRESRHEISATDIRAWIEKQEVPNA